MAATTINQLYETLIKPLTVAERLQLTNLILEELADNAPKWGVEMRDFWDAEDLRDLARASLAHASQRFGSEVSDV